MITITWVSRVILMQNLMLQNKDFIKRDVGQCSFALLKRIKSLSLPPDIALKLFDTLVKPVVLYGAEVWGCENCDIVNKGSVNIFHMLTNLHALIWFMESWVKRRFI